MERRIQTMTSFLNKEVDKGTKRTRCFTDGEQIWSYGTHFVLAEWTGIKDEGGREIVLVNKTHYSMTTSKMQGEMNSVLHHDLHDGVQVKHIDNDILHYYLKEAVGEFRAVGHRLNWSNDPEKQFHESISELKKAMVTADALNDYNSDFKMHADLNKKIDYSLEKCRTLGKMGDQLETAILMMVKNGTERYDEEIKKMPVQYASIYKLLGGKTEIKKSVKNALWNYLWLKDHIEVEDAILHVSSDYPAIRDLVAARLEGRAA
jgi:hypothetical protein